MSDLTATVRNIYAAVDTGDIPAVLALLAPDIRWTGAEGGPYGGVSIGTAVSFQQHTDTALQLRAMQ